MPVTCSRLSSHLCQCPTSRHYGQVTKRAFIRTNPLASGPNAENIVAKSVNSLRVPLHRTSKLQPQVAMLGYRQFTTTSMGWVAALSEAVATRNR